MNQPLPSIEDQLDIKELLLYFRKNWIVLCTSIFLFGSFAFLYSQLATHFFQSSSKFITKTSKVQNSNPFGGLASLAGLDIQNQSNYDPSLYFTEIVQDDEFLNHILQHRWLLKNDSLTLETIWNSKPDTSLPNWQYVYQKRQIAALKTGGYITLEKNKTNGVITLTTLFEDADLAYQINTFVIDLLGNYLYSSLKTQAKQKRLFIASRIDEIEKKLQQSEDELVLFQQQNNSASRPNLVMQQTRLFRNVKINEEMLFQLRKEFELAKLEELKDQPLIEVISKPTIAIFREKPQKKVILTIGLLAGFILGMFLLCTKYWYSKL